MKDQIEDMEELRIPSIVFVNKGRLASAIYIEEAKYKLLFRRQW